MRKSCGSYLRPGGADGDKLGYRDDLGIGSA